MTARAAAWLATGVAVAVSVYVTGNWSLLWFLLIPAFFA